MPDYSTIFTRSREYMHGTVMFGNEWPTEAEAWKLDCNSAKGSLTPCLSFTQESPAPKKQSWRTWRGLSFDKFDSPAALLMHYPLSVYHLLVDILRVVDQSITSARKLSSTFCPCERLPQ
jgi:hypothetical protein